MNHYAAWKNILIVLFLFILGLYALPNLYGSDLAIQISGSGNYEVNERDLDKINDALSKILKREKRYHLYEECLKFLNTRVNLDLASFSDDIWSH